MEPFNSVGFFIKNGTKSRKQNQQFIDNVYLYVKQLQEERDREDLRRRDLPDGPPFGSEVQSILLQSRFTWDEAADMAISLAHTAWMLDVYLNDKGLRFPKGLQEVRHYFRFDVRMVPEDYDRELPRNAAKRYKLLGDLKAAVAFFHDRNKKLERLVNIYRGGPLGSPGVLIDSPDNSHVERQPKGISRWSLRLPSRLRPDSRMLETDRESLAVLVSGDGDVLLNPHTLPKETKIKVTGRGTLRLVGGNREEEPRSVDRGTRSRAPHVTEAQQQRILPAINDVAATDSNASGTDVASDANARHDTPLLLDGPEQPRLHTSPGPSYHHSGSAPAGSTTTRAIPELALSSIANNAARISTIPEDGRLGINASQAVPSKTQGLSEVLSASVGTLATNVDKNTPAPATIALGSTAAAIAGATLGVTAWNGTKSRWAAESTARDSGINRDINEAEHHWRGSSNVRDIQDHARKEQAHQQAITEHQWKEKEHELQMYKMWLECEKLRREAIGEDQAPDSGHGTDDDYDAAPDNHNATHNPSTGHASSAPWSPLPIEVAWDAPDDTDDAATDDLNDAYNDSSSIDVWYDANDGLPTSHDQPGDGEGRTILSQQSLHEHDVIQQDDAACPRLDNASAFAINDADSPTHDEEDSNSPPRTPVTGHGDTSDNDSPVSLQPLESLRDPRIHTDNTVSKTPTRRASVVGVTTQHEWIELPRWGNSRSIEDVRDILTLAVRPPAACHIRAENRPGCDATLAG